MEIILSFAFGCYQYSGDTQKHISLTKQLGTAVTVVSYCLEAMIKWLRVNQLKLDLDKMVVMLAT